MNLCITGFDSIKDSCGTIHLYKGLSACHEQLVVGQSVEASNSCINLRIAAEQGTIKKLLLLGSAYANAE
jgi:hypothetical protein